jgi:CRISPR-associated protein Cas5t
MNPLPLRVEVPVCAFRPYASREYQDTFPFPAPSSVYGMLLSLLGVKREEKSRHRGAEMALAVDRLTGSSKVFRKLRRGNDLENSRPDYQDLLMDLRVWIWLRPGADAMNPPLSVLVPRMLARPQMITRSGGLSLGESSYLVDSVTEDASPPASLIFLLPDKSGFYSMPVWVDHTNARNTVLDRFRISVSIPIANGLAEKWIRIGGSPHDPASAR